MINDIKSILNKLNIEDTGTYDDHSYIIPLEDSNDYARMYTILCDNAVNIEYPSFGVNSSNTTVKVTNYFEITDKEIKYSIFLVADFENEKYYLQIKEA